MYSGHITYSANPSDKGMTHRGQGQGPVDEAFCTPSDTHTDPKESDETGSVAEAHLVERAMEVYPPNESSWIPEHKTADMYIHTLSSNENIQQNYYDQQNHSTSILCK